MIVTRTLFRAFTLIELLVVIAIISILLSLLVPALAAARATAKTTEALSAAKSLGYAYAAYATENRSNLLPGYLGVGQPVDVKDEWGNVLSSPADQRWVFRLAPYFGYQWSGTTLIGTRKDLVNQIEQYSQSDPTMASYDYQVSVFPSFGLNYTYIGGDYRNTDSPQFKKHYHVTREDLAAQPSNMIVFGSSRFNTPPSTIDGYIEIDPPPLGAVYDPLASTSATATAFGFNAPRYSGGSAVCFLDYHGGTLKPTELLDRRHWSDAAFRANDPNWQP